MFEMMMLIGFLYAGCSCLLPERRDPGPSRRQIKALKPAVGAVGRGKQTVLPAVR